MHVKGAFHFMIFQTLQERYFWIFSEHPETSLKNNKIVYILKMLKGSYYALLQSLDFVFGVY